MVISNYINVIKSIQVPSHPSQHNKNTYLRALISVCIYVFASSLFTSQFHEFHWKQKHLIKGDSTSRWNMWCHHHNYKVLYGLECCLWYYGGRLLWKMQITYCNILLHIHFCCLYCCYCYVVSLFLLVIAGSLVLKLYCKNLSWGETVVSSSRKVTVARKRFFSGSIYRRHLICRVFLLLRTDFNLFSCLHFFFNSWKMIF